MISCTDDWLGGSGYDLSDPDQYITEDLEHGRVPMVLRRELPAILLGHWPCFYANGGPGFQALKTVKRRLDALDPEARLPTLEAIVTRAELLAFQAHVRSLPAARGVKEMLVDLVLATRPVNLAPALRTYVTLGVSPRGAQSLLGAARARAACEGRLQVSQEDVRAMAIPALRHRVLVSFAGRVEGVRPETILAGLL